MGKSNIIPSREARTSNDRFTSLFKTPESFVKPGSLRDGEKERGSVIGSIDSIKITQKIKMGTNSYLFVNAGSKIMVIHLQRF